MTTIMTNTMISEVSIYTGEAALRMPGQGGYAAVLRSSAHRKDLSGGYTFTTLARLELFAVIEGLRSIKRRSRVMLYTNSAMIIRALNQGWLKVWQSNGWRTRKNQPVPNADLWQTLLALLVQPGRIERLELHWTRGEIGNAETTHAAMLARQAAEAEGLPVDEGYGYSLSIPLFGEMYEELREPSRTLLSKAALNNTKPHQKADAVLHQNAAASLPQNAEALPDQSDVSSAV